MEKRKDTNEDEGKDGDVNRAYMVDDPLPVYGWCISVLDDPYHVPISAADTPPQKKIKLEGSAPGTPSSSNPPRVSNTPRGSISGGGMGEQQQPMPPAPVACKASTPISQVRAVGIFTPCRC